ncbi:DNA-3-methyladenine glycosylase family protein [Acrocarpospora catenulata]|uniref:DNA-3-methyladenine glycosylase family protein n=1 Tax=Acrocarpospora catenulata TaxID=2836182 RepID=UPI001BDA0EA1|nr:DNA-3-methyladenine glycosylase 2 family protein [Acrocarpospora catenulata]
MIERVWSPRGPLDVALTLAPYAHGSGDPVWRRTADGAVWRACRTPQGTGTLRLAARGGQVHGTAWGEGAEWLLETFPALLGADDDVAEFAEVLAKVTADPALRTRAALVGEVAARHPGLRIGRSGRMFESLVPAVLEQKVVGREAFRAWRWLVRKYGEAAPGPAPEGLTVPPDPERWRLVPSWDWHRAGAEAVRARTILNAARHADKLEQAARDAADRLLRTLPGIGVWTSAEIRQRVHGDPDAPSFGDYHIPGLVGYAFTGAKTDDAGMFELLQPFAGQRHRVVRLIELSGLRPPARGPRMAARDYRSF